MTTVWKPRRGGFSLIELMLVLAIMGVVMGMALLQIGQAQPSLKGDGAMRALMAQLNTARELSISQRRQMQVIFTAPSTVQIVRQDVPAGTTSVSRPWISTRSMWGCPEKTWNSIGFSVPSRTIVM